MRHKCEASPQNSVCEDYKEDYAELSFGEDKLGTVVNNIVYFNQSEIKHIQNIFQSFYINRLNLTNTNKAEPQIHKPKYQK